MKTLVELDRRLTPFAKPQAIFLEDDGIWLSSLATQRVYWLERATLAVRWETPVPEGLQAWGLTRRGDSLWAVVGGDGGPDDVRTLRRLLPGQGFDPAVRLVCPDQSGSHLSFDGQTLYLSQWYPRKILALDEQGKPGRVLPLTHGVCGHCYAQGAFWALTTDEEEAGDYWLTRIDPVTGENRDLGRFGFPCRGLGYADGSFWTNHRAAGQLVRLAAP